MSAFLDHFSAQARAYARYRPTYPSALFDWLEQQCGRHELVWDCATGNGQAAAELAQRFDRVIATDASAEQIAQAPELDRVDFRVATAETSGLPSHSVDLVTVATALHWFDLDRFEAEAKRVLRSGGVLAVWTYAWSETDPAVHAVMERFAREIVGPYWSERVPLAWSGYRDVSFDLAELETPAFETRATWSSEELLGYLSTWSATQSWAREHGSDPTLLIADAMGEAYDGRSSVEVRWPLHVRAFRAGS